MRATVNSPGYSSSLTFPAGSVHSSSARGTPVFPKGNPLVALVRSTYGYELFNNLVNPNHKSWEQLTI